MQGPSFVHLAPALAVINSPEFQKINGNGINPVVVAHTIAAVGLCFCSYGFPLVGTCIEIGAVQIVLVIIFSLVLLGLSTTWAAAFLLTEAGAYSCHGCHPNIPASNVISEHFRKHVTRMKMTF